MPATRRHFHFGFHFCFHPTLRFLLIAVLFATGAFTATAQPVPNSNPNESSPAPAAQSGGDAAVSQISGTGALAATAAADAGHHVVSEFCQNAADWMEDVLHIHRGHRNTWERWLLAAGVLVLFYLALRLALPLVFRAAGTVFKRARLGLAERIVLCLEKPAALFLMVVGVYMAASTLHHSPVVAGWLSEGARILFAVILLWAVARVAGRLIDFAHDRARQRQSPVAAFMPWIRKAAVAIIVVVGALEIMKHVMGLPIETYLAGLGIGGLAFALAAQDTIANIFGAVVVAIDQPFRHGDMVQIAGHTGTVEDVGVRSTKLRRTDKAVVVIPNKTVAAETIVNVSRSSGRRIEEVLNFTYDSTPEQMAAIVADFRALIEAEPAARPGSGMVFFRDLNPSSLDVWIVYEASDPDFRKHMELRERLNLAFMRAVAARGMSFAFPTQTIDLAPSAAKVLGREGRN